MSRATRVTTRRNSEAADDYLELVRRFPLRRLVTSSDYEHAIEILVEVGRRADAGEASAGENDYADVLSRLIRDYDEQHSSLLMERAAGRRPSPVEMLKFLVEQHNMNTVSLGKLVGGSGQASMILRGKREMSKANIRKLAEYFHVSPALFI